MTLASERIGQVFVDDFRIEFTEFGGGSHWVVLLPGQLMPRRMHQPVARMLAANGAHVVTVDLLGHGRSDRPEDPMAYSTAAFAHQVVALLDHLGAERAVIGGTALGANVALEVAVAAPERVQGLLIDSPALDNAVEAGLLTSTPLLLAARFLPAAVVGVRLASRLVSRVVPRGLVPFWIGVGLDTLDQRPAPMAAALHGIAFGRLAPSARERAAIEVPALVIGHPGDPLHPVADATMLAEELTGSRYLEAPSLLGRRGRSEGLDAAVAAFVAACFEARTGRLLGASS